MKSRQLEDEGHDKLSNLYHTIKQRIIGQEELIEHILVCLLCGGHMLIEGMPGLAKTTAAKAVSKGIEGDFHRIQFTPDLLPSDLIGTEIYVHEKSNFTFRQGPLFNNIILADEINRAPAKVQSALLEAMEERQITVGHHTYTLPEIYMVLATQNPVEQEGTYNLPEAQLDRFLLYSVVGYPSHEEERQVVDLMEAQSATKEEVELPVTSQKELLAARKAASNIYMEDSLKDYVVSLVGATRHAQPYDEALASWLEHGASPRATLALIRCSKALAWLQGEEFVTPYHIQRMALPILRHRISLSFEAQASNVGRDAIVKRLLEVVAVP